MKEGGVTPTQSQCRIPGRCCLHCQRPSFRGRQVESTTQLGPNRPWHPSEQLSALNVLASAECQEMSRGRV